MLLKWSRQHGSDATLKKLLDVLFAMKKDEIVDAIILQVNDAASPKPSPSCSERAKKLEEKSRAKWQKNALKNFKKTLQLYEERLQEIERVQQQHFITKEAQEIKDSLRDIDRNYFADHLNWLHAKIEELEYSGQRCSFREQQLRVIADRLYKLDKTLGKHCESLGELRVLNYQQVECAFAGLCVFRYTKIPIGRQSRRYSNSKDEEVSNDDEKKMCPHIRQEEHTRRKLRVSITDDDEQSQLSEFVAQFCRHYQQNRPFTFEHCLFNGISPGSRSTVHISAPPPLSIIDPNTLPTPRYQSSEVITDLFTRPKQTRHLNGWVNEVSVWI
ncbi:uncharacterized protein LOC124436834 isoform X2 [Xenia sp. Carnegie-2017]|nr:uncharacterized protein LOC124436834 isoform X2 [Xenia sp. Carnegie-2017]